MSRHAFFRGAAVAACLLVPTASRADTIYTDYAEWHAAASALGVVADLTMTPQVVPIEGATVVDDELTVIFGQNHGGISVGESGWQGDVHLTQGPHSPGPNLVTFSRPVVAFGATASVGFDFGLFDRILIDIGDTSHRLMRTDYSFAAPAFWGWIGDAADPTMVVRSDGGNHSYALNNVQYVATGAVESQGAPTVVPLPAAVWGGVALLGGCGISRYVRRHRDAAEST